MKPGIIAVVVIVVIAAVYLLTRGNSVSNPYNQSTANPPTTQTQGIQNDNDLTAASNDLDNTDLNNVDGDLNQNDTDTSAF